MTTEGLIYINSLLESLEIPYEYGEWSSEVPGTYFTGEYNEIESFSEAGKEESDFILTGNTINKFMDLETVKDRIKKKIGIDGLTAILGSGQGIAVLYSGSMNLPSVQYGVHRIQITLRIKEWKVNEYE